MDDWLVRQITFLGMPFQNWMVVTFALILIAAFLNVAERR